ncbi:hypothetical protein Tco_1253613 [Tanacetum coccineum]
MAGSRVGMEMLGMITRDLGLGGSLPQPLTLLGRSTHVRHPNVQTETIRIYLRCLIVRIRTAIALGTLLRIAGLNRAPGQGGNHPNQVLTVDGVQGRGNNSNHARKRAFMLGAEEARKDPNIMTDKNDEITTKQKSKEEEERTKEQELEDGPNK